MHRMLMFVFVWSLLSMAGAAQTQPRALPDSPSPSQPARAESESTNPLQSGVAIYLTLQKKSVVFPDLATARRELSGWEKCKLAANNGVAPSTIGGALLGSAYGQLRNKPAGYGQETGGYGKRFGADMARSASYNLFGTCLLASITHEDPRFYAREKLSLSQSLRYAAGRLFITRSDSGEPVVYYSGLLGPLASEALADTYYPSGSRGLGSTLVRYSADIGWRFGGNLLRQYWPVISKRVTSSQR